jgi:ubiquinone/menaquinone biosynthesis C-methylase UbiE
MKTPYDEFFERAVTRIFTEKKSVIDIGGGLRIDPERNNRYESKNAWILPLARAVEYKVMDPVDTYHPDIVGDIHDLPFGDNSQEAFVVISILEHVENPILACKELHRTLEPGGLCLVYVPFLYYYHAEAGYYKDYWRFTHDTLALLFKDFSAVEFVSTRGAFETVLHLLPGGKSVLLRTLGRTLDRIFGKVRSKQTSGYYLLATK